MVPITLQGKPHCSSGLKQPFQEILHQESENSKSEHEEQDKSAELSGFGLPGQVPDDPEHEGDEEAKTPCHANVGDLFFS
jgi:hypothetical protein